MAELSFGLFKGYQLLALSPFKGLPLYRALNSGCENSDWPTLSLGSFPSLLRAPASKQVLCMLPVFAHGCDMSCPEHSTCIEGRFVPTKTMSNWQYMAGHRGPGNNPIFPQKPRVDPNFLMFFCPRLYGLSSGSH